MRTVNHSISCGPTLEFKFVCGSNCLDPRNDFLRPLISSTIHRDDAVFSANRDLDLDIIRSTAINFSLRANLVLS
ncbi:MAG: hypothetical protein NVS3B3_16150 [Aquirhabdus sp.]